MGGHLQRLHVVPGHHVADDVPGVELHPLRRQHPRRLHVLRVRVVPAQRLPQHHAEGHVPQVEAPAPQALVDRLDEPPDLLPGRRHLLRPPHLPQDPRKLQEGALQQRRYVPLLPRQPLDVDAPVLVDPQVVLLPPGEDGVPVDLVHVQVDAQPLLRPAHEGLDLLPAGVGEEDAVSVPVEHLDAQPVRLLHGLRHRVPSHGRRALRQGRAVEGEALRPEDAVGGVEEDLEGALDDVVEGPLLLGEPPVPGQRLVPRHPEVLEAADDEARHPPPLGADPVLGAGHQVVPALGVAAEEGLVAQVPVPDGGGVEAGEVEDGHPEVDPRLRVPHYGSQVLLPLDYRLGGGAPLRLYDVLLVGDEPAPPPVLPLHEGEDPAAHPHPGQVLHSHLADPPQDDHQLHGEAVVEGGQLVGDLGVVQAVARQLLEGELVYRPHLDLPPADDGRGDVVQVVLPVPVAEGVDLDGAVEVEPVEVDVEAVGEVGEAPPHRDRHLLPPEGEVERPLPQVPQVEVVPVEGEDHRVLVQQPEGLLHEPPLVLVELDLGTFYPRQLGLLPPIVEEEDTL